VKYLKRFFENIDDKFQEIGRMIYEIDELRYILQDEGYDIILNDNKITQLINHGSTVVHFKGDDKWVGAQSDFLLEFMDRIREICEKYGFEVESQPSKMEVGITDTQKLQMLCFQIKHKDIEDNYFNKKFHYSINDPKEKAFESIGNNFESEIKSLFYILEDVGLDVELTKRSSQNRFMLFFYREGLNKILKSSKKCKEFLESYQEFIDRITEICSDFGYKLSENSPFIKLGGVYVYSEFIISPK